MPTIHRGATLVPHFRDFLPGWVARQPWYRGTGEPSPDWAGAFRFEDPAGEVGLETYLVASDEAVHHVPLTYRGAPLAGAAGALVATAEHSVLGTRWIYDGAADPVWRAAIRRLVADEGVSDESLKRGVPPAAARGIRLGPDVAVDAEIRIDRVLDGPVEVPAGDALGYVVVRRRPETESRLATLHPS